MSLQEITEAGYPEFTGRPGVAVLEFGAVWCPPCKVLLPILEELSQEYGETVSIAKVDADESPELASQFGIMGLPTVIVFKDGQPVDKLVGLRPKGVYQTIIERYREGDI
ncbi:thioredoxin [Cohnella xylanilytica]|uniref:thioredoxin family protein n=1 Tax=Cohnella xylanilytica TaxID=557555 RepID=UPI001B1B04B1|nr:thioredoxin family protein [Cohnella xylanilytica]GIO14257.1 thioredoxin [Cohnella xylanilytica]